MNNPNTIAAINRILLQTAITADPVVERSKAQKLIRLAKLKAELFELGYIVERIAREKAE